MSFFDRQGMFCPNIRENKMPTSGQGRFSCILRQFNLRKDDLFIWLSAPYMICHVGMRDFYKDGSGLRGWFGGNNQYSRRLEYSNKLQRIRVKQVDIEQLWGVGRNPQQWTKQNHRISRIWGLDNIWTAGSSIEQEGRHSADINSLSWTHLLLSEPW